MVDSKPIEISDQQRRQFEQEGYFVIENAIPPNHLEVVRDICEELISETDQELERDGLISRDITHKGKRYFIDGAFPRKPRLGEFLFSEYMAEVCRATIGPDAFLFKNQYVVKCAEVGMNFSWHQDSGYIAEPHEPYLTCWCALDDVAEENGTVYILPWSQGGGGGVEEHVREQGSNDLVGYFGDEPGVPVVAPAGSIAVFSSRTFHRSGANPSKRMRRIYLAQYSPVEMPLKEGTTRQAVPFVKDGQRIAENSR
jgi:ectoine hydroxylase-related dioxygenase (phytanoyl-CoA dioxygenase family)